MTDITTGLRRPDWRIRLTDITKRTAGMAVDVARRARSWRATLALPGLTGMTLISIGAGLKFGAWAGLVVAGVFALRIDGRL